MENAPTTTRHRSRAWLPWAVTLLLAASPLAVASAGDAAAPDPHTGSAAEITAPAGTLKVKVVKPARKRVATVVVTGPDGFRRVLHRTTKLSGLEPGRYRVRARTVRTSGWYSKPEVTRSKVGFRASRTARTTVSYWTVVSTLTTVLKAKDIRTYESPQATPGSTGTIVLDEKVPIGTILAAGITPDTPAGALVEVVSASKAGTGWSYVVRLLSVEKAVPRRVRRHLRVLGPGDPGGSGHVESRRLPGRVQGRRRDRRQRHHQRGARSEVGLGQQLRLRQAERGRMGDGQGVGRGPRSVLDR